MGVEKEMVGAASRLLVLSVLAGGASYGYEVVKRLNAESRGSLEWQEGTIYPVLHKLEKEGLVRGKWQDAETGRRRKYYYITAAGRAALAGGVKDWTSVNLLVRRLSEMNHG